MMKPVEGAKVVPDIVKTLDLAAAPARVWRALTDPKELVQWFPDEKADVDVKPGAQGNWVWENHGSYAVRFEVVEPNRRLVWSWAREADITLDDAFITTVEFKLEPTARGGTTLYLRESGFVNQGDRRDNDGGWDNELRELVAYLDRDPEGLPATNSTAEEH